MPLYRVSKFIEIDAAHRVPLHESKCKNLHGHRYKIQANVTAELLGEGAQDGMVLDFSFIKQILTDWIDKNCDHGIILSINDDKMIRLAEGPRDFPFFTMDYIRKSLEGPFKCWCGQTSFGKTFIIPYVPTAENLARFFYEMIRGRINSISQGRATLESITVWETPTSEATYPVTPATYTTEISYSVVNSESNISRGVDALKAVLTNENPIWRS